MKIVAYGAGTNGTGMLVGLHERGITPDAIVFADTGGERPNIYQHIIDVSEWCLRVGFPSIRVIKGQQPMMLLDGSLEGECLRLGALPAKAHGYSTCSLKWKVEPQRKHYAELAKSRGFTLADLTVMIGFDADEQSRVDRGRAAFKEGSYQQEYPLFDWGWTREDCVAAIARSGLTQPGKSACFYCPSTKKEELLELRRQHPELVERALEMERRAKAGEGKADAFKGAGLGRSWNWGEFLRDRDASDEEEKDFLKRQMDIFSPEQCDSCIG